MEFQTNRRDGCFIRPFWALLKIWFSGMLFGKSTQKGPSTVLFCFFFLLKRQITKPTNSTFIRRNSAFYFKKNNIMLYSSSTRHFAIRQACFHLKIAIQCPYTVPPSPSILKSISSSLITLTLWFFTVFTTICNHVFIIFFGWYLSHTVWE